MKYKNSKYKEYLCKNCGHELQFHSKLTKGCPKDKVLVKGKLIVIRYSSTRSYDPMPNLYSV